MVNFKTFFNLILEDLQSSINQGTKILTSNEFTPEEASQAVGKIKGIMDEVVGRGVPNQQKRFNTDSNIPILSYILLALKDAGGDPYVKLKREYQTYLASEEATKKKILTVAFDTLRNEIQGKKLFKPSPEKTQLIVSWGTKLIEEIHKYIKADETEAPVVRSDEDVVYENDDIAVYRADSKNKCIAYGAGSNLCISTKGGGNFYWAYRMGEMRRTGDGLGMTTYFVFWKDTNERILIDALGNDTGPANKYSWNNIEKDGKYDNVDKDITPDELIEMHPELREPFSKNVFQFIPYGEDEKRFKYIQDYIEAIEDRRLKTLKDYEMFLEGKDPDDYTNSVFIPFVSWIRLIQYNNLSLEKVKSIVKKYAALNFNVDIKTQKELLSPADRAWYLNTVISKRISAIDILGYISSVHRVEIPDELYKILSVNNGGYGIYRVWDLMSSYYDADTLKKYFSPNDAYRVLIADFDNTLIYKLKTFMHDLADPGDLLESLLFHYKYKSNKKIPKEFYKLVILYPQAAFQAARFWKMKNNTNIPKVFIKSAIKDPYYAYAVAEELFDFDEDHKKDIPNYIRNAIFKDPRNKYSFIENAVDGLSFENYPSSEIADLFSKENLGYKYAIYNNGFGVFDGKNNIGHQKVRRTIYKNIMKNAKKAYYEFIDGGQYYNKEDALYKMLKRAHDIHRKTLLNR